MADIWVITFPSVYHAYRAEKLLKQQGIMVELIPVPRQLTGGCEGLAAQIEESWIATAVELLEANRIMMVKKGIKLS